MSKQQSEAYTEAIEEYRAASHARMGKPTDANVTNVSVLLPKKQISNYFVQFRKVCFLVS